MGKDAAPTQFARGRTPQGVLLPWREAGPCPQREEIDDLLFSEHILVARGPGGILDLTAGLPPPRRAAAPAAVHFRPPCRHPP